MSNPELPGAGPCPNPACPCDPCTCAPPCLCGLTPTGRSSHEAWDPTRTEYRVTRSWTFAPTGPGWPSQPALPAGTGQAAITAHEHVHGELTAPAQPRQRPVAEPGAILAELVDSEGRDIAKMINVEPPASHAGHGAASESIREAEHNGHKIRIKTTYELSIDGQVLTGHMGVANDGTVHYHGLPNYSTNSAIDLMKQIIDSHPDYYPPVDPPDTGTRDADGHEHGDHEAGVHHHGEGAY